MTKKKNIPKYFIISSWKQQAMDDLNVATMGNVSSYIRCFHAQQSIEKMLKTAYVMAAGTFKMNSPELIADRKQAEQSGIRFDKDIPACAWELGEGIKFPLCHDLVFLWQLLIEHDKQNRFRPLSEKQKYFMEKASEYAVHYRYPFFSQNIGTQVAYISDDDVNEVICAAKQLYDDLFDYISSK